MKTNPTLSIVTINFNNADGLKATISSVLNQQYEDFEYIIVDGGSTDNSVEIIKDFVHSHPNGKKISYWVSEKDKGIYDAMNKGIEHATGEYVGLINSGDFFESDTCNVIVKEIERTGRKDVYSGILKYLDERKEIKGAIGYSIEAFPKMMISHQACFIRNDVYKTEKYDLTLKSAADLDLIFRLRNKGCSFVFVEKVLGTFDCGGISASYYGIKEGFKVQLKYKEISKFNYFVKCFCYKIKVLFF